jgi:asparagine synthase (glutamine-hydrolysing)
MCGLVGALSFNSSDFRIKNSYIKKMRDTMTHRGPNGKGCWINKDRKIGFGHRRLSIIDLSQAANQPMSNSEGSITLVFNGEIYNHSAIRSELEILNKYIWKTNHSDTEVLLYAFQEWGISFIDHLKGMFSIAIWDSRESCLWLIRDRVGIKPLYYSIHNNRVVFASEIKALLKDPDQKREINEEGVFDYLSYLTVPAPNTLFKGIKKLPNGTWMRFNSDGSFHQKKYWDVLDKTIDLTKTSEEDISIELLKRLRASVELRKVSDVPVGVFLSGGIDSSTNAALFSESETSKIKTFSIGYEGSYKSYKNETKYAKLVADYVNANYYEKLLTPEDLINFLPEMIRLQDEPIGDPVCVPLYYVSKLAKEKGVTVCQVGEGADELFLGYPFWKKLLRYQEFSNKFLPKIILKLLLYLLKFFKKDQDWAYEAIKRVLEGQPIYWGPEPYTHNQKISMLSSRMKKTFNKTTSWEAIKPIHDNFIDKSKSTSDLDWMSYIDLNLRLPELLLMRVDKMSMGVSLEARVPFLDHDFVEFAMSIPSKLKAKNGELKYILKKAVRGIIPNKIIDRKKQGFSVPMKEFSGDALEKLAKLELENFCKETDILDWNEVQKYFQNTNSEFEYNRRQWWPLLNLAMWWSFYIKNVND